VPVAIFLTWLSIKLWRLSDWLQRVALAIQHEHGTPATYSAPDLALSLEFPTSCARCGIFAMETKTPHRFIHAHGVFFALCCEPCWEAIVPDVVGILHRPQEAPDAREA
jgi:hypothetical protein